MFRARIPHNSSDVHEVKIRLHDRVDGKRIRQEVKAQRQWDTRREVIDREGIYYPEEEPEDTAG